MSRAIVPCGSCTACCRQQVIVLDPHQDDIASYQHAIAGTLAILKHKPNGDCVYLGEHGCTIHARAPKMCREFDCRLWYLRHDRAERKRLIANSEAPQIAKDILDAGRERWQSLADDVGDGGVVFAA
jgi:uncharacterized protein